MLNFWATWCIYFSEELRDLNLLDWEFKKAGDAVILAVNAEEPYDKVGNMSEERSGSTVLTDETRDVSAGLFRVFSFPNVHHKQRRLTVCVCPRQDRTRYAESWSIWQER